MDNSALGELFLEIEKHALYRAHASLVGEARKEMSNILATDKRIVKAAQGMGMVSETDSMEEVAVLVCGLHNKIGYLESVINKLRIIEKIAQEMADQLEVDNPNCASLSKYFDVTNKPTPSFINHCVPVNGVHAPFCTGHEKHAEHEHDYLNSIYCSICGHSEF